MIFRLNACFAPKIQGRRALLRPLRDLGILLALPALHRLGILLVRTAKRLLDAAENDPTEQRHIAINALMLESLLGETEVTSSDYNTGDSLPFEREAIPRLSARWHVLKMLCIGEGVHRAK